MMDSVEGESCARPISQEAVLCICSIILFNKFVGGSLQKNLAFPSKLW